MEPRVTARGPPSSGIHLQRSRHAPSTGSPNGATEATVKKPLIVAIAAVVIGWNMVSVEARASEFAPVFDARNFDPGAKVDNPYFTLRPGTRFVYRTVTKKGCERVEVEVKDRPRRVHGVITTVVRDRVWVNDSCGGPEGDVLVEDTRDWYAQDIYGNVWYFGEDVDNYVNGVLVNHQGSWEAGIDGAEPGIIMMANPQPGDFYRQERAVGIAEDVAEVVALGVAVTVPYGTFQGCLQTRDSSLIDKKANEYKYYCPAVGQLVLDERVSGPRESTELVGISAR